MIYTPIFRAIARAFHPTQIPGCVGYWDVDDAVDNSGAEMLPDRSGAGNHVIQETPSARCTVVLADADFNGHSSLQGATGDYLRRAALVGGDLAQPTTKYAVIRTGSDVTTNQHIFSGAGGASRQDILLNGARFGCSTGTILYTAASVTPNTVGILRAKFNGASLSFIEWTPAVGVKLSATGNAGTAALAGTTLMGFSSGLNSFTGKGAMFIVYSGIVSSVDDARIKTFLRREYQL